MVKHLTDTQASKSSNLFVPTQGPDVNGRSTDLQSACLGSIPTVSTNKFGYIVKKLYFYKNKDMSILTIILVLIVIGLVLWLINSSIPMDPKIKSILNIVVVIFVILWLLSAFGVLGALSSARI